MFKNLSIDSLGVSGRQSEIIELALSYNFKGLDVDLVDFAGQVSAHGLPHARRLLDSARLKAGCFALPISCEAEAGQFKSDLAQMVSLCELAQQMGWTRAVVLVEPAGDTRPYHESFEHYRRRLGEIAAALAPLGIRLGADFRASGLLRQGRAFQFIQAFDALLLLVRGVGAPNLGIVLDLWNWHLGGGTIDHLRGLTADKIVAVYVCDIVPGVTADAAEESSRRLPGETGVIDAAAVLALLAELGYDGPVTPRPGTTQFQGLGRDKIVRQTAEALDRVWKPAHATQAAGR